MEAQNSLEKTKFLLVIFCFFKIQNQRMFINTVSSEKKGVNDFSKWNYVEVENKNVYIEKKVNKKINVKKLKMNFFDSVFSV